MNSFRKMVVVIALAAIAMSGKLAYSQQEVAPDFFDGSPAQVHKAGQVHKAAPVHQQKHAHALIAKKSSAKHHHAHASA